MDLALAVPRAVGIAGIVMMIFLVECILLVVAILWDPMHGTLRFLPGGREIAHVNYARTLVTIFGYTFDIPVLIN